MKKLKKKILIKKTKKNKIVLEPLKKTLFFLEKILLDLRITKKILEINLEKKIKLIKKEIAQLSSYSIIKKN